MLKVNIVLLLILLLLFYTTISTLYIEVNYISVVTSEIKTVTLKRGNIFTKKEEKPFALV